MSIKATFRKIAKKQFLNIYHLSPSLILWFARKNIINTYQPVWDESASNADRSCSDRWDVIKPMLPVANYSFLDIGAQIGYFTLSAANVGACAIGIERDPYFIAMANAQAIQKKVKHIGFLHMDITPDMLAALPKVDVTCCLSVFHHWVREYEFTGADKIFSKVCENTEALIFETGQSDEPVPEWQHKLAFMGENPQQWIEQYLKEKGFTTIKMLGQFGTHLTKTKRVLFYATKK